MNNAYVRLQQELPNQEIVWGVDYGDYDMYVFYTRTKGTDGTGEMNNLHCIAKDPNIPTRGFNPLAYDPDIFFDLKRYSFVG